MGMGTGMGIGIWLFGEYASTTKTHFTGTPGAPGLCFALAQCLHLARALCQLGQWGINFTGYL